MDGNGYKLELYVAASPAYSLKNSSIDSSKLSRFIICSSAKKFYAFWCLLKWQRNILTTNNGH